MAGLELLSDAGPAGSCSPAPHAVPEWRGWSCRRTRGTPGVVVPPLTRYRARCRTRGTPGVVVPPLTRYRARGRHGGAGAAVRRGVPGGRAPAGRAAQGAGPARGAGPGRRFGLPGAGQHQSAGGRVRPARGSGVPGQGPPGPGAAQLPVQLGAVRGGRRAAAPPGAGRERPAGGGAGAAAAGRAGGSRAGPALPPLPDRRARPGQGLWGCPGGVWGCPGGPGGFGGVWGCPAAAAGPCWPSSTPAPRSTCTSRSGGLGVSWGGLGGPGGVWGCPVLLEGAVLAQLYPRSQIDVHVQVLQADGGELGASVSAAGLALLGHTGSLGFGVFLGGFWVFWVSLTALSPQVLQADGGELGASVSVAGLGHTGCLGFGVFLGCFSVDFGWISGVPDRSLPQVLQADGGELGASVSAAGLALLGHTGSLGFGVFLGGFWVDFGCFGVSLTALSPQVLQADGGELGASVSAAGLALLDAGVALRGAVVAGSAGLAEPPAGPPVALSDLSAAEEAAGGPRLAVATVAGSGQLALCQLSARLHQERLRPVLDAALAACRGLHAVLDGVVRARLRQDTAMEQ
uniref:Exoribonuclease phosphorolytic domain-containing protein n=1 Tax=Taeniopygia guttata TaxID=59729 RepID=A0A674HBC7_TAEGU